MPGWMEICLNICYNDVGKIKKKIYSLLASYLLCFNIFFMKNKEIADETSSV